MQSLELGGVLGTVSPIPSSTLMPRSLRQLPALWYSLCVPHVPGSRGHVTHEAWAPEHSALNTETGDAGGGREPGVQCPPLHGFKCPLCWPVTSDKAQIPWMPASSFVKEGRGPLRLGSARGKD